MSYNFGRETMFERAHGPEIGFAKKKKRGPGKLLTSLSFLALTGASSFFTNPLGVDAHLQQTQKVAGGQVSSKDSSVESASGESTASAVVDSPKKSLLKESSTPIDPIQQVSTSSELSEPVNIEAHSVPVSSEQPIESVRVVLSPTPSEPTIVEAPMHYLDSVSCNGLGSERFDDSDENYLTNIKSFLGDKCLIGDDTKITYTINGGEESVGNISNLNQILNFTKGNGRVDELRVRRVLGGLEKDLSEIGDSVYVIPSINDRENIPLVVRDMGDNKCVSYDVSYDEESNSYRIKTDSGVLEISCSDISKAYLNSMKDLDDTGEDFFDLSQSQGRARNLSSDIDDYTRLKGYHQDFISENWPENFKIDRKELVERAAGVEFGDVIYRRIFIEGKEVLDDDKLKSVFTYSPVGMLNLFADVIAKKDGGKRGFKLRKGIEDRIKSEVVSPCSSLNSDRDAYSCVIGSAYSFDLGGGRK